MRTRNHRPTCLYLAAALCLGLLASPLLGAEAFTEIDRSGFDKAAAAERQRVLHGWLMSERAGLADAKPLVVAVEPAAVEKAVESGRLRVGAIQDVGVDVDLAGLPALGEKARPFGPGAVRAVDGGWVFTTVVRSPGAAALRVRFEGFFLPNGAELYVYTRSGQAVGPYTRRGPNGDGRFWSHTVFGDEALVQVRHRPTPALGKVFGAPRFRLAEVGHVGDGFSLAVLRRAALEGAEKSFCSFNEPCTENVNCSSPDPAVSAARDAVASILFASGRFLYICSGGLLADTDTGSTIPYFLTANHCISKSGEASSMEAFFQFDTPCGGACYDPDGVVPSTLGATILSSSSTSDYTLMQLSQSAPAGSAYMGWSSSPVANSNNAPLYRISHPAGAPQAYSEQVVDTAKPTCGSWPRGNWIYSRDTFGATEGGSSGSPVLNGSGQVVGQLSGACGFNVNDPCDEESNATVDGALAAYFSSVDQWLDPDPGGGCTDADGDGYCAEDDCDDFDASVNPGASEACGDGVDNDCDGSVDEGCSACLPSGSSCSVDSDCCSNKCKGGRNKSCKG